MRYPHADRDPSFEYRYRKMREFTSRPFKFDISAPGMETDSDINNVNFEGLNVRFDDSSPKVCTLSQKTKDFIGENLIDIENTLKALNLDFLQTFNDLEKNDSAETLFGENYAYDANHINPKILNTALKLSKLPTNYSSIEVSPKSTKSSQYSPLEKQSGQQQLNGSLNYLNESGSTDKLLDGKRSSTPDTGFASRETNTSSRRGSQKSSYSPQDTHFSPSYSTQIDEARAAYAHLKANGSFPSRQRSMSFTENYDLKSPVLSEPQFAKLSNHSTIVGRTNSSDGQAVRRRQRNTISHKPKSIRARNLRRLSYNPIILDSSSSSSSETEFNHRSVENFRTIDGRRHNSYRSHRNSAVSPTKSNDDAYDFKNWHTNSESDIRLKNRKSQAHFQSNISFMPSQDKLYGSNASIKSAPQYNNFACDRQMHNYLERRKQLNYPQIQYADYDGQPKVSTPQTPNQAPNAFERNAQRSSSRRRQQQQALRNSYVLPPPPPPPASGNRTYDLNQFSLYSQFDVSKLTGKSPTTQCFLQDVQSPSKFDQKQQQQPQQPQQPPDTLQTKPTTATISGNIASIAAAQSPHTAFQWPEKIHVSAVTAPNANLMWPQKQSVQSMHTVNESNRTKPTKNDSILNFFSFNMFNLFD